MTWKDNKTWSDKFIPEIKSILGGFLLSEPPKEEDAERNTDLIVLKMESVRIACRMRSHKYLNNYWNEFTIRSVKPSGCKTELTKIIEGWGNYFFYGFSDFNEQSIEQWIIGDLNAFRIWFCRSIQTGNNDWKIQNNVDGSSSFLVFDWTKIDNFICASSENLMVQNR